MSNVISEAEHKRRIRNDRIRAIGLFALIPIVFTSLTMGNAAERNEAVNPVPVPSVTQNVADPVKKKIGSMNNKGQKISTSLNNSAGAGGFGDK